MNKTKKMFLLSILTILITSCGPQRSESTTDAKVYLGALTGISNPVMLYGGSADSNEAFAKKILPTDGDISLELTQGNWRFYALYWDGANPFEGNLSCYSSVKTIEGDSMEINIALSQSNCDNERFFPAGLGSQDPFVFTGCSNLDGVTSFSSVCNAVDKGIGKSYKLIYPQWSIGDIENVENTSSTGIISNCISPGTATSIKLPIGNNDSFFSPVVLSYDNSVCSGVPRRNKSLKTFRKGTNLETKEFSDGTNNFIFFTDRSHESLSIISNSIGDSCDNYFQMTTIADKTIVLNSDTSYNTNPYVLNEETFNLDILTPSNSQTSQLHKLGNQIIFNSYDSTNGTELWVTDGTVPGTFLLKDINPGSTSSYPNNFYLFNGKYYFLATTANEGTEIWTTDGTQTGTYLVTDLNNLTNSGVISPYFQEYGSELYFSGDDGSTGAELYKMDTSEQISLVQDINPGATGSNISLIHSFNNMLYYNANDGTNGNELYSFNGQTATRITNFSSTSPYISDIQHIGTDLVFKVDADAGGTYGEEIYRHDGVTVNAETLIADLNSGPSSSYPSFVMKTSTGDLIYRAYNGLIYELYKIDSSFGIDTISSGIEIDFEDSIRYKDIDYLLLNLGSSGSSLYKYNEVANSLEVVQGVCPSGCNTHPHSKFGISAKGDLYIKKNYYDGTNYIINILKMGY